MNDCDIMTVLSKNVKRRMVALHINQKEIAKRAGITEVTISRYIHGHRKPTIDILYKIAKALECSIDDLLTIK